MEDVAWCGVDGAGAVAGPVGGANEHGKNLFEQNCKQCHALDRVIVGPALDDVTKRRSTEWLYNFINNSQTVIKQGDPGAVALFEKYSGTVMPPFPSLSRSDIDSLLQYIDPQ